jgi:hypothetical protein
VRNGVDLTANRLTGMTVGGTAYTMTSNGDNLREPVPQERGSVRAKCPA